MKASEIILYIDTGKSEETIVEVSKKGRKKAYREKTRLDKSQNVLLLIEKALRMEKIKLNDITAIKVNPGPGSFTGTRVGVSVANALAWTLGIPINGKKIELPVYEKSKFEI